tara:strand:+ start:214087 stop:214233 length:147 start_codon:yes stop_codon:yes gene_type:complete
MNKVKLFFCDGRNTSKKEKALWLQRNQKLPIKRVSIRKLIWNGSGPCP